MRIDLEFRNGTEFPVSSISLGKGERYEWGDTPNERRPIRKSVRAPEGWWGNFGYQFEGIMMTILWRQSGRENFVAPGGRLEGLSFEMPDESLPPSDLPFNVNAYGKGCLWSRWTLETVPAKSEP